MKTLLIILLIAASAHATEQNPEFKYDPNSPEALATKAQYDSYKRDGQALQTRELYKEIERLEAAKKARIALAKPEDMFAAAWTTTDDDKRSISYTSVLQQRSESGDPLASFFHGFHEWNLCSAMQRQQGGSWAEQAPKCWQGVMTSFKRASDGQIADATFNIARLYQNGWGVTPSKLAAAEWYVKSANQYNKANAREDALTAVESALDLVPDHPAALRLRKAMLK